VCYSAGCFASAAHIGNSLRLYPGRPPGAWASTWDIFAATWRKNKGIEDLVPAFTEFARMNPHASLTVLGAGVPDEVVRGAFPAEVRVRVHPVSTTSDAAAAAVFADSDLFLLPSLFEGTPLTLLEAMASGLPIVTTATCGMKDMIREGANGLLVPIRSPSEIVRALTRLRDDRSFRATLGRTAREVAAEYTWDRVAVPVAEAYRRLTSRRTTASAEVARA